MATNGKRPDIAARADDELPDNIAISVDEYEHPKKGEYDRPPKAVPEKPEPALSDEERQWRAEAEEEAKNNPGTFPHPNELEAEEYFAEDHRLESLAVARAKSIVSVRQLVQKPVVERPFLIGPKLFPKHGRMLITGMSGTGKSTLTLYLAACLASKQPFFGILNTHKDEDHGKAKFPISDTSAVLYLDYELPEEIRAQDRLKPLVARFPKEVQDNLFFVSHPSLYRLHNQVGETIGSGSFDALQKLVGKVRPDVLIVDPLSSAHSLDENSIAIKQALNNVDKMIDLNGCAAIIVHHSSTKTARDEQGKKRKKATIEEPRGHSSLVDWCDVHMHFAAFEEARDEDDEPNEAKTIEMSFGKSRYCRCPDKCRLKVNFEAMEVTVMRKGQG